MQKKDLKSLGRLFQGIFSRSGHGTDTGLRELTRLVRRFAVEQQQVPRDLAELVELDYLETVPVAPAGQRFIVDRRKVEVRLEPSISENGTKPPSAPAAA